MAFMHEFPHTHNFDSDLREILEMYLTVKDLPKTWETYKQMMDTEFAELKAFVNDYFDNLNVQNEINNKIDSMIKDGTMTDIIRPFFNEYNQELNVLKARMDTFTKLEEGSTTGDAELSDIRIDYKGNTHETAGDAVREQVKEIYRKREYDQKQISLIRDNFDNDILCHYYDSLIYGEAITYDGETAYDSNYVRTDYIPVIPKHAYCYTTPYQDYIFFAQFDENKNCITVAIRGEDGYIIVEPQTKYIIFSFLKTNIGVTTLSDGTYQVQHQKNNDTLYKIVETMMENNDLLKSYWKNITYDYIGYFTGDSPCYHKDFATTGNIYLESSIRYYIKGNEFPSIISLYNENDIAFNSIIVNPDSSFVLSNDTSYVTISVDKRDIGRVKLFKGNTEKDSGRTKIIVGVNGDFEKFSEAISFAYNKGNCDVIINEGTYNIIEECGGDLSGVGLDIGRGMHIIASPQAYIICEYEGDNSEIRNNFSVLNAREGDFTIEGLNIKAKNIRYCVHDELVSADGFRIHEYNDCTMYIDNSNSGTPFRACIGCGLGSNTKVVVNGGYYESVAPNGRQDATLLFHNGIGNNCKSEIIVKNVYIAGDNGNCRFGYYGTSEEITKCFVIGCNMDIPPVVIPETAGSNIVNMEMFAWNNVIRSQQ